MKDLIDAKDSDVFDVLAYVAFATETQSRRSRVKQAESGLRESYDYKQLEFINFVLRKYIDEGVHELSASKMSSLLELKYQTVSDAATEFGDVKVIRDTFFGFQRFLYEERG